MVALLTSLVLSSCSAEKSEATSQVEVPVSRLSSDEARERGREIFEDKCALCHGDRADGRGPRGRSLARRPTDFTNPQWRASTTPSQVFEIVSEGVRGTSMPGWPTLSEDQKWDVTAYVLSVAEDGP
jgi:mono/diheme cytochrome c family protein